MRGALAAISALFVLAVGGGTPLVESSAAMEPTVYLQSPSHNIACVIFPGGVRCDIRHYSWPVPPKPKSCEFDYGGGLSLSKHGKAYYNCVSDTVLGMGKVLPYGRSRSLGRFRCTSKKSGMRCVNRRNGHGFLLARESIRLF
jgi:hypothetical protein